MIFFGVFLIGFGVYDKIGVFVGVGFIVLIIGFVNLIVLFVIEYKKEGFVFGVGSKMFLIVGFVFVYGIFIFILVGFLYYFVKVFSGI